MDLTLIKIEAQTKVDATVERMKRDLGSDSRGCLLANIVSCADTESACALTKTPIAAISHEMRSDRYKYHARILSVTMTPDEIEDAQCRLDNTDINLSDWI